MILPQLHRGLEPLADGAELLDVNFRAARLIDAAPYLTAFQSQRLLFCGSAVLSAKEPVRQEKFWCRGVSP
jgi:hypothetical protein